MEYNNIINIEKCYKEEKIIKNDIAFIRPDLTREIIKMSFGIRFFLANGEIKEEYYDCIYKESLQDGVSYYPNQECYPITQGETSSGNIMKQGMQFRIYFNNIENCPPILVSFIGEGNGTYVKRINKGKFIEKIIEKYGFRFGHSQDEKLIRKKVLQYHPQYMDIFEEGYSL